MAESLGDIPNSTSLHELLSYDQVLPEERYSRVGQGGQFCVHMLTDPLRSQSTTPFEKYVLPKVIKIPLSLEETTDFVANSLGFEETMSIRQKAYELLVDQYNAVRKMEVRRQCYRDPFGLWTRFGSPQFVLPSNELMVATGVHTASNGTTYIQRYCQPIHTLMTRIDYDDPVHDRVIRNLIRQSPMIQIALVGWGLFDADFKITDNQGVNEDQDVQIIDFSELTDDVDVARDAIEGKKWEVIVDKSEYTQLPSHMQDYYNLVMEKLLTPEVLRLWGTDKPAEPKILRPSPTAFRTGGINWLALAKAH